MLRRGASDLRCSHAKTSATAAPRTAATLAAARPAELSELAAAEAGAETEANGADMVMLERAGPDAEEDADEEGASVEVDEAASVELLDSTVVDDAAALEEATTADDADDAAEEAPPAADEAAAEPEAAALLAEPPALTSEPVPHAMPAVDSVGLVCRAKSTSGRGPRRRGEAHERERGSSAPSSRRRRRS